MAKSDPQDPGPVPTETPKRTRRPGLPLSDRSAELVRKAAEYTGQTTAKILELVAAGEELTRTIERACLAIAQAHDRQREQERNKIFGALKVPAEGES